MKRYLLFVALLALMACDKPYVLKISKNEGDLNSTIFPTIKSYDFKAPDNETAYSRSAEHFYKDQAVDSLMDYVNGNTVSFEVSDKEGESLRVKLSYRATDSIDNVYKKRVSESAKHMRKIFSSK